MKVAITLILTTLFISILSFYSLSLTSPLKSNYISLLKDTSVLSKNTNTYDLQSNKVTNNKTHFEWQKSMPWIGAVLVGILTVLANIYISQQNRKSNFEIINKQINNTKRAAQLDFNKTVLSGNRQIWINDLRELISRILANTMTITIKQNISSKEFENLKFLLAKTELMLNVKADKEILNALHELEKCYLDVLMGNKEANELEKYSSNVKLYTQATLKNEWEKVKRGE